MPYIATQDRTQLMMCSFDMMVKEDSFARLVDAFANSLNLSHFGIKEAAVEGRPCYNPKDLLKLYIYGYRKGIRSSRKLEESCKTNIEVKWMIGGVEPDFRTISDFRKNNTKSMKAIFHEFNKRLSGAVEWGFSSVDGSKFIANNSKDSNFTKNKLDDRIKWLNAHTDEYMRILEDADSLDYLSEEDAILTREVVEEKLREATERLQRYEEYQKLLEETGASQLSLTDADAKLMKNKNGFAVAYNPQTAVDSNTHLIHNYEMTNQVTDHGMLYKTLEEIKSEDDGKILEVVADKGYENSEDMIKCLENGIIPHVIMDDGKDGYQLEVPYVEAECDAKSTNPEELSKCIHNGQIPEVYQDVLTDMEVTDVRRLIKNKVENAAGTPYGTDEEMMERAKEGYFVRDPEKNLVYCPAGEILRQKSIRKDGTIIRYSNKSACRHCKNRNKCYKGQNEWKEVDFTKDKLEKPCKDWLKAEGKTIPQYNDSSKRKFKLVKVVKFTFRPDRTKMAERMCLSEHPFGTLKRSMGFTYFLLRGLKKVDGEFALACLAYNIERAKNLIGFNKLMSLMVQA
jgi:transposase